MERRGFWLGVWGLVAGCSSIPLEPDRDYSSVLRQTQPLKQFQTQYCDEHGDALRHRRELADHIIQVNPDGLMVRPGKPGQVLSSEEGTQQFRRMLCEAQLLARHRGEDEIRVLVYVHGGLNNYHHTNRKVQQGLAWQIMMDPDPYDWHYPVFISWKSSLPSSWWEHSRRLREGNKAGDLTGLVSLPFVVVADAATTVGRYPATVYYQGVNEKDRAASRIPGFGWARSRAWKQADRNICDLSRCEKTGARRPGSETDIAFNMSDYHSAFWNSLGRGTSQLLTAPVRYTAGTLYHSSVASASWDVMKRRTQTLFYPASDFDQRWQPPQGKGMPGGLFFPYLLTQASKPESSPVRVTLVGHSMGTMIVNRALQQFRADWVESSVLENVVYMAAADSIENSLVALEPVLTNAAESSRPVNFYNLTLNRVAEVSEMHAGGLVPTGSLLVSIDQHHEGPEHPLRRTLGSEVNVLSAQPLIAQALEGSQGELVFKAFDRNPGMLPARHGDFGKIPFWRREVWRLATPVSP